MCPAAAQLSALTLRTVMLRNTGVPITAGAGARNCSGSHVVPNAIGVQEGAYIMLCGLFGVPPSVALANTA